jgi:hypothetical protein
MCMELVGNRIASGIALLHPSAVPPEFLSPAPTFRSASNRSPVAPDRDRRARQRPARLWAECSVIRRAPEALKKGVRRDIGGHDHRDRWVGREPPGSLVRACRLACAGALKKGACERYRGQMSSGVRDGGSDKEGSIVKCKLSPPDGEGVRTDASSLLSLRREFRVRR